MGPGDVEVVGAAGPVGVDGDGRERRRRNGRVVSGVPRVGRGGPRPPTAQRLALRPPCAAGVLPAAACVNGSVRRGRAMGWWERAVEVRSGERRGDRLREAGILEGAVEAGELRCIAELCGVCGFEWPIKILRDGVGIRCQQLRLERRN